ncbi:MAG: T9SS type A sorting domain-containing protein [Bacteroidetes bacterium]|nr:T9SS type A sorting domain-containing protein [Bacteroidota bacterium]
MKFIKLLFISLLFTSLITAQSISESKIKSVGPVSYMPYGLTKVNYPGESNIDITYYKLNLTVQYNPNYLIGVVTVEAKSQINGLDSLFLDLDDTLTVSSVISNNNSLAFSQPYKSRELRITLDKSYNFGEKISLIITYQGIPISNPNGFGSFTFGTTGQDLPSIFTLSEPYGASDWWPCKDTPADKADSADIWITCSDDLKAISNGNLMDIVDNGNGTHTYKWKTTYPIAQYLISMAIAPFSQYDIYFPYNSTDSLLVSNFLYRENMTSPNKAILDKTLDMLSIFSDKYGPYPFLKEKYGHAQFGWGGGMEHQTITSIGVVSEELIAHELAHSWFGDKITCKNWESIWLNEGFATFSTALYFEFEYNKTVYNNYINDRMDDAKSALGSVFVQNISTANSIFNWNRSYAKGSVVLHMLRGIVGDINFFNIMKSYAADSSVAYGVAETADFQRVAESIYSSSLNYFFDEWIFGENYPKYNIVWGYSNLGGGQYSVNLNISQTTNTNPRFFTMPVQLKISFGSTDTLVTVFNDKENQVFYIVVNGLPTGLDFDPNNYILKDVLSIVTGVDNETIPRTFTLEQNYPNPFNPTTTISYSVPEKSFVSLVITDLLGRKITELVNEEKTQGSYTISFNAKGLSSGIYFYTLTSGNFIQTKKMLLMK